MVNLYETDYTVFFWLKYADYDIFSLIKQFSYQKCLFLPESLSFLFTISARKVITSSLISKSIYLISNIFLYTEYHFQIFFYMASKTVYSSSCTTRCPTCSKSMLLKNWKDHCRQMHTMSPSAIDTKYNEMKQDIDRSRLTTVTLDVTTVVEKPIPVTTNTLFSMKKFALTKSSNLNVQIVGDDSQTNPLQLMEWDVQNTTLDSTIHGIESSPTSSSVLANINEDGMISYSFSQLSKFEDDKIFSM